VFFRSLRGHRDGSDVRIDNVFKLGKIFLKHPHKPARGEVERLLVAPGLPRLQDAAAEVMLNCGLAGPRRFALLLLERGCLSIRTKARQSNAHHS
jgi:hypothetical protein